MTEPNQMQDLARKMGHDLADLLYLTKDDFFYAAQWHRELGLDYEPAITALREALAEQPAQQEPVACQYAQDVAMPEYRCIGRCQYDTSPPAQRKPQSVKVWDAEGYGALCQDHADLMAWKDKLLALAIAAHQPDAPKNPEESACKYCRAKTSCDALRSRVVNAAKTEFSLGITPDQLEDAALCAAWADAVQDEAKKQLAEKPDSIKGWAMKPGARMVKFKDEKMVAELLKGKPEAFSLKSASSILKLGIEVPAAMIEETRKAASLVKKLKIGGIE